MKNLVLSLAFMLIGTFAFASSGDVNMENSLNSFTEKIEVIDNVPNIVETSCTVTASYEGNEISITSTCECTQTEACDKAYAILRVFVKLTE